MIEVFNPRFAHVAQGAGALERRCTGAIWSEGPVWMARGKAALWSDIPNNRKLRWTQLISPFVAERQIISGLATGGVKR